MGETKDKNEKQFSRLKRHINCNPDKEKHKQKKFSFLSSSKEEKGAKFDIAFNKK